MDNPTHQTQSKRPGKERKVSNPLKYTFDGQFLPTTPPDDDKTESNSETTGESSDDSETRRLTSAAASFQLLSNTVLRMELAQLEMIKNRETARLEAQRRQSELEYELTRMMLQTQSHIASFVSQTRKRKSHGRKL